MPVQLLVIDQGSLYVENLLRALTPDSGVELIGRARDIAGVTALARTTSPDVVFVDVDAIPESDQESFSRVAELFPTAHIFILTELEEVEELRRTIQSPMTAMIAKEAVPSDVIAEIRNAGVGAMLVHREFVPSLVRRLRHFPRRVASKAKRTSPLTPRETEVLSMLSRGTHVDAIARKLDLSVHTVRGHVKNILAKLESHSQLEAVAKAKDLGWVPEED
jgi:DNA-binding NarL/FixJ family response regulator